MKGNRLVRKRRSSIKGAGREEKQGFSDGVRELPLGDYLLLVASLPSEHQAIGSPVF